MFVSIPEADGNVGTVNGVVAAGGGVLALIILGALVLLLVFRAKRKGVLLLKSL